MMALPGGSTGARRSDHSAGAGMGTRWTACDRYGAILVYSASWAAYFHYCLSALAPDDVPRVTPECRLNTSAINVAGDHHSRSGPVPLWETCHLATPAGYIPPNAGPSSEAPAHRAHGAQQVAACNHIGYTRRRGDQRVSAQRNRTVLRRRDQVGNSSASR